MDDNTVKAFAICLFAIVIIVNWMFEHNAEIQQCSLLKQDAQAWRNLNTSLQDWSGCVVYADYSTECFRQIYNNKTEAWMR